MPVRTVWTFFTSPRMTAAAIHVAERGVFPAGHDDGQIFLRGGEHPGIFRVNLIILFVFAAQQNLVEKFVREIAFALFVGGGPDFEHGFFHAAHRFAFGDAGVRHAVHVAVEQRQFVLGGKIAVARHALVIIVRDEIKNILLQIRAGASNQMNLVLPDHFGEREAEFRRAHCAAERDHHFAAGVEVRDVAFGGVHERRGVEMAVMVLDEFGNRSAGEFRILFFLGHKIIRKISYANNTDVRAKSNLKLRKPAINPREVKRRFIGPSPDSAAPAKGRLSRSSQIPVG